MSLYTRPAPEVEPEAKLHAAHGFVRRCLEYAEAELTKRRASGRDTTEWESYARFTRHTLAELEAGTLDSWFTTPPPRG